MKFRKGTMEFTLLFRVRIMLGLLRNTIQINGP